MTITISRTVGWLRLRIPRGAILAVAAGIWLVFPGAGLANGNPRRDKAVTADKSAAADNSAPEKEKRGKDKSTAEAAAPAAKSNETPEKGNSAKSSPSASEDQVNQLNEKVKKLEDVIQERQLRSDEKINRLEEMIERQQQESNERAAKLQEVIDRQQKVMEALEKRLGGDSTNAISSSSRASDKTANEPAVTASADSTLTTNPVSNVGASAPVAASDVSAGGLAPAVATSASGVNSSAGTAAAKTSGSVAQEEEAPLSLRLGSLYLTPMGFADFSTIFRSTNVGNGLPTNFGSIPYSNTPAGQLTEIRPTAQGTRPAARVDAMVGGAHVIGYVEFDFLGFVPTNAAVVYNNSAPRLRLAFVDVRKDKFEILGGQAWSLMSPDRKGLSPLPDDLYYPHLDPDNQLGLVWNRDPQFRFIYHASDTVTMGFSVEEPEQYIGGFGGAGTIVLPSALATPYGAELNNGGTTLNTPNIAPDFVAKIAFDPMVGNHHMHIELAGLERNFRVYNPLTKEHFSATGGGGSVNLCLQLTDFLKVISYNYYSDGGGRYIFGQAPDLAIRGDGSISLIHAASTVEGLEIQASKKTLLYAYYGGVLVGRDAVVDPVTHTFVGYGFPGSSTAQNRIVQEPTFGLTQTLWKEARYGQLQLGLQYSYVTRSPWVPPAMGPRNAATNMFYVSLRYALPNIAPKLPYSY